MYAVNKMVYTSMIEMYHIGSALQRAGVEDWVGYDEALSDYALYETTASDFDEFIDSELKKI